MRPDMIPNREAVDTLKLIRANYVRCLITVSRNFVVVSASRGTWCVSMPEWRLVVNPTSLREQAGIA